jgi:hypothetical protein
VRKAVRELFKEQSIYDKQHFDEQKYEYLEKLKEASLHMLQQESELLGVRVASYSVNLNGSVRRKYKQSNGVKKFKELFAELQKAIAEEDYLEAARIKNEMDELKRKL